jgi:hypothetical protein
MDLFPNIGLVQNKFKGNDKHKKRKIVIIKLTMNNTRWEKE